jgi:hypothetical protein
MASVHSVRGSADWDGPAPRAGMLGAWDRFVGPGATAVENALFIGATAVGAAWVVAYGLLGPVPRPRSPPASRIYGKPRDLRSVDRLAVSRPRHPLHRWRLSGAASLGDGRVASAAPPAPPRGRRTGRNGGAGRGAHGTAVPGLVLARPLAQADLRACRSVTQPVREGLSARECSDCAIER